jgi:hypothetical protein
MKHFQLNNQHECPQVLFVTLLEKMPREIINKILLHWITAQRLTVDEFPINNVTDFQPKLPLFITYRCDTDRFSKCSEVLPPALQDEYWYLRHLSWLKSAKLFTHPYDFYMSHYLLSLDPNTRLPLFTDIPSSLTQIDATIQPLIRLPHSHIATHGLEHIILDFDAPQYFALFNVRVPPFDTIDTDVPSSEAYPEANMHGAASLLQHCIHLTLVFGDAYRYVHPWYDVQEPAWDDARCRPHVCEMGKVINWIMSYAWAGGYLQHLEKIEFSGDVQDWVKEKWENGLSEVDIEGIQSLGKVEGEEWRPEEYYPPKCECEIGCWKLGVEVDESWGEVDVPW